VKNCWVIVNSAFKCATFCIQIPAENRFFDDIWINVTQICSVKFAPSSGLAIGSPLMAAAAESCGACVAAPPTSPCSPVLPGRRGGTPSGDLTAPPALSLRAEETEALVPPPCTGETREENFPSRVIIVGDEGEHTFVARTTEYSSSLSAAPLLKDVARGFVSGPLTLGRDP